jgi:hypothetical protein
VRGIEWRRRRVERSGAVDERFECAVAARPIDLDPMADAIGQSALFEMRVRVTAPDVLDPTLTFS